MAAVSDSSLHLLPPKRGYSSRYRDAQTQTSRRDRASYHCIRDSQTVEVSPTGRESPGPAIIPRIWKFNKQPAQTDWTASQSSQSSSIYTAPNQQDSGARDWEADLAVFRMSWYDALELFNANSCGQAEDGKEANDPDIVEWDGPDDPGNPLNWSTRRKWANIITFSTITMIR